jgi:hypothetical protein
VTWSGHDHRGECARTSHSHSFYDLYDVAEQHHRHYDLENLIERLREDLNRALGRIAELEREASDALKAAGDLGERVRSLERSTPEAQQAQYEADVAAADLAASGYDRDPPVGADRHGPGCQCPYCYDEEDESPLARRDAYIGTWSNQDVTRRGER